MIGEKIAFQIKEYSFSPILRYLSKIWLSLAILDKKKCTLAPHAQPKLTQHTIGIFRSFFPHASIINLSTNLESNTTYTWKKSIVYHQFWTKKKSLSVVYKISYWNIKDPITKQNKSIKYFYFYCISIINIWTNRTIYMIKTIVSAYYLASN